MIELASVLLILLLFVFPLPVFAASLGLLTTRIIYKKYESFKAQPAEGKKIMFMGAVLFLINFICSVVLGAALAFMVQFFIFDNFYLFIFNFLFCSAISLRWFDFTHHLYRLFIFRLKPRMAFTPSHFVICRGFRERDGLVGLAPVYTDAGILELKENRLVFKGVFREETISNIIRAEKKSSDKIKIFTEQSNPQIAEIFLITLKEKFYPFKSRQDRDNIFKQLQPA